MSAKKKRDVLYDCRTMEDWERRLIKKRAVDLFAPYFAMFMLGLIASLFAYTQRSDNGGGWIFALIFFAPIGIIGFVLMARTSIRIRLDLFDNVLAAAEGHIRLDIRDLGRRNGVVYKLYVEDLTFTLTKDEFLRLSQGQPYRIYYAPRTKIVVDAEPL